MVSQRKVSEAIGSLSVLRGFPVKVEALAVVGRIVVETCKTDAQVDQLIDRMTRNYDVWPGPQTLRSCMVDKAPKPWKPDW